MSSFKNKLFLFCKNALLKQSDPNLLCTVTNHCATYSFFICRTWSMVTTPAQLKFSLYWLILMDSSHSDTDLKGEPSEPLVLGRRMDTLEEKEKVHPNDNTFSHNKGS